MVPRAVASLLSYEAERRMMRANDLRAELKREDWAKQRGLLRFGVSEGRPAGLPLFLLVYPCIAFARHCDPRDMARQEFLSAEGAVTALASRIRRLVENLNIKHEIGGVVDERWYWLVPMLLDLAESPEIARAWWERPDLAQDWAGTESGDGDEGWSRHVSEAAQILEGLCSGSQRLGAPPTDLYEVLALAASAAPATAALRAFIRTGRSDSLNCSPLIQPAAQTGRAFLSLFNHAEVIEMVRAEFPDGPYWLRALQYSHAGCLQGTLDEYSHLLRESLGCSDDLAPDMVEKIAAELIGSLTLRTASLRVDEITVPPYARELKIKSESMHIRFAMRFGDERSDEEVVLDTAGGSGATRKERVRAAFNSPFWPFVLVSTSLGQEGLDFHHYCHAITHWNLPSNPVDLEQREGRIHRFKGHAIRKNIAAEYGAEALRGGGSDVWEAMFDVGRVKRSGEENDLVPFWLFPGDAKIERHVPAIPFSREVERLHDLRRALAIYRMVFGQSRQEDLIAYILTEIPEGDRLALASELKMNLMPKVLPSKA
jgi:helicase-like protein